jgi:hypothetical protein
MKLGMVRQRLLDPKNSSERRPLVLESDMIGIGFDIGVAFGTESAVEGMTKMSRTEDTLDELEELVGCYARVFLCRSM